MVDVDGDHFLLPGAAICVNDDMLRRGHTIGAVRFMHLGLLVLYIVRKDSMARDLFPNATTEITEGDWLYCLRSESKTGMALDPLAREELIPCDKWPLPTQCHGFALGPSPRDVPLLAQQYAELPVPPSGFLDMRNRFQINIAGIRRDGEEIVCPGATFVIRRGDVALLARVSQPDGSSEPAYKRECLAEFEEFDFSSVMAPPAPASP